MQDPYSHGYRNSKHMSVLVRFYLPYESSRLGSLFGDRSFWTPAWGASLARAKVHLFFQLVLTCKHRCCFFVRCRTCRLRQHA